MLTRGAILGAQDLASEMLDVPEWGGQVRVRELSAAQMAAFKARSVDAVDTNSRTVKDGAALFALSCWVVAQGVVDADGARVFGDEDVDALGGKSDQVIERLAERILGLSGAGMKREEAEKNSAASRNGSSGSGSR